MNCLFGYGLVILLGTYLYIFLAVLVMEVKSQNNIMVAIIKALTWPVTIWNTIKRLHEV